MAITSAAQTAIPRPTAPGVEFIKSNNSSWHIGNRNQADMHLSAPKLKTAPMAPSLMEQTSDITTKDTLLVTGYVIKDRGSQHEYKSESITYDKYGRRATITAYNDQGETEAEQKYTYEVGPFNYWTKKLVQERTKGSDEWYDCKKEEREIDENGNLTRKRTYELKEGYLYDEATGDYKYERKLILKSDARYDYAHAFKDGNDAETRGALVELYEYEDNGELAKHTKYQWAECAKAYICVLSEPSNETKQITIGDDHITETYYHKNDNGELVKSAEEIVYYDNGNTNGYITIFYAADGITINDAQGYKTTQEMNIPSEGWVTTTTFRYDAMSGTFLPDSKKEVKGIQSRDKASNYARIDYDYKDDSWNLSSTYKTAILDGKIYKTELGYGSYIQTLYQKLDDNDSIIGTVTFNDDNSYKVTTDETYNEEEQFNYVDYYYYDAAHNLLKAVRCIKGYKNNLPQNNYTQSDNTNTYYELKDGKWVLTKEYEVKESGYQGYNFRTVYTFTDEGYPSVITEYTQKDGFNGGKELVNGKTVYTYSDNGYKVEEYSIWSVKDMTLQLDEYSTYYILADGRLETTHVEYDDEKTPGTIYSGSRYITQDDGSSWTYKYNKKTASWDLTDTYVPDFQEFVYRTEDDGTNVTIQRRQGDNGEVINVAKTERLEKRSDDGKHELERNAEYLWDEKTSSWVGTNKYEKERVSLDFGYLGINPITQYDDEYMPHSVNSPYEQAYGLESQKFYKWDTAANNWVQYKKENEDTKEASYQIDGNKLTYTTTVTDNDRTTTKVREILVNNDNFITSDSNIYQYKFLDSNKTAEEKELTTYKYNRYGKLEEKNEENYVSGELASTGYEKFIYEEAKILPTLIDELPLSNGNKHILIDGLKITCDGQNGILLYDGQGRLTARGTHFVMAPKSGIYVVKTNGETMKVMVK